jgi:starch phosphorylase
MTMMTERLPRIDKVMFQQSVLRHVTYSLGTTPDLLSAGERFHAVALAVRDLMVEGLLQTEKRYRQAEAKQVYYLSMEFLIGRSLHNNLVNLGLLDVCVDALAELGINLGDVEDSEVDAALGNGGLGRLAACFLDSLATLGMPGFGYGINYEYGLFKQEIRNGEQFEKPDNWRTFYTPWQIQRPQNAILVPIYGRIEHSRDRFGAYNPMWLDWGAVLGVPDDMPIVGYGGRTVNYLRLYSARALQEVDLSIFNVGDYINAVQQQVLSETISKVLYPSDSAAAGRELRLLQEYFLSACAVRDIVSRFGGTGADWESFSARVAIQLNDTHPTLAIAEFMRILVDENNLPWEKAWDITTRTFAYTNHTLLPEALERFPVPLLEKVIPRHLQIIHEINRRFLEEVAVRWPGDNDRLRRMSLIEEGPTKQMRMAHLAIIGGHSVNGVAAVHSRLVQTDLVPDFYALTPAKFNNKTNGVTQRRWLLSANPELSDLITKAIGPGWVTDLDRLRQLEPLAADRGFEEEFLSVKRQRKQMLARIIKNSAGVIVDANTLFDVHVKRIHEYKRQLLNVLHIIHDYLCLVDDGQARSVPRTYVFAGKAAPGYHAAKQIIRLINQVASVINADARAKGHMQVVFIPDYRVTLAEAIFPAADLSEQISTAGTEASGTSNMKFAMNGALTIATLDGANIEIREEVGPENIFIFGLTVEEVRRLRGRYQPWTIYGSSAAAKRVLDALRDGRFCPDDPEQHAWACQKLLSSEEQYFHLADFDSYLEAHAQAAELYGRRPAWAEKAIRNVARMGKFSSDTSICAYASDIWNVRPAP